MAAWRIQYSDAVLHLKPIHLSTNWANLPAVLIYCMQLFTDVVMGNSTLLFPEDSGYLFSGDCFIC